MIDYALPNAYSFLKIKVRDNILWNHNIRDYTGCGESMVKWTRFLEKNLNNS